MKIVTDTHNNSEIAVSAHEAFAAPGKAYLFFKRTFDIVMSVLMLVLLSPLLLAVSIVIAIEDGFPVIHKRVCVGKARQYVMYKFRSMKNDADKLEKWLTPEQIEEYKKEIKLDHDPRITRSGRFIRRFSIDELPQLVTILKGDMSFVGPRPIVPEETHFFGGDIDTILTAKPGLTGYWQVNGRSNCTYKSGERQKMELFYVKNRSLSLDAKIIFKTFGAVFSHEGAK